MYQKLFCVYDSSSLDAITSLTFLCYSCRQSPLSRCSLHSVDSPRGCVRLAWQIPSKAPSRVHSPETHSNGYSFFVFRISKRTSTNEEKERTTCKTVNGLVSTSASDRVTPIEVPKCGGLRFGLNQQMSAFTQLYQTIHDNPNNPKKNQESRIKDQKEETKTYPAISKSRTTNAYSPGVRTAISEKTNTFFPSPFSSPSPFPSPFPVPFSLPLPLS